MSVNDIAHTTWPDGRPENIDISIHSNGPLRDIAEAVMRKVAENHIVMSGARTFMLDANQTETHLEYMVFVEIDPDIQMLWHHHFTFIQAPWSMA